MSKHNARCLVCSKFVTWNDMLDDGMCVACATRLKKLVDERTRIQAWIIRILLTLVVALALVVLTSVTTRANETTFREDYFVTGVNTLTNERVVGWISGVLGQSEVSGHVLDRGDHYVVVGHFNGKGQFELRSLCCTYDVVVTDEVLGDKIENRKQWQESWK